MRRLSALNRSMFPVAVLLALTGSAVGQDYRGGGGTMLDRNQQVGGTGVNSKSADIRDRIWLNNQIITGSAPGGKSFRGYVGYTAPAEFRGVAGSNSSYQFRRDSTSSAQVQTGVRASDALRYQMGLTTSQAVPAYLSSVISTPRDANAATAALSTGTSSALRSTADYLSARALRPTLVGQKIDKEGREFNAVASPLTGLNWLQVSGDLTGSKAKRKTDEPKSDFAVPGAEEQRLKEEQLLARYTLSPTGTENLSPLMRLRKQREDEAKARTGNFAVTTDEESTSVTRAVEHTRIISSVSEAYKQSGAEVKPEATKEPAPKPGEEIAAASKPKSAIELELDRISRVMRGLPINPPKPKDAGVPDGVNPFEPKKPEDKKPETEPKKRDDEKKKPLPPELIAALRAAGVKNIESLAPAVGAPDPEWYRVQMLSGQKALAEQRYFDAEDGFTRAIGAMPNDPLAKVGRVHAQLGAALFLSASNNLRGLLKAHPEMTGTTFDAKLMPSPERIREIVGMLRENIEKGGGMALGSDAGLLLGYLGHISGDKAMCEEGLKAFSAKIEPDNVSDKTLEELLKGVWIGEGGK